LPLDQFPFSYWLPGLVNQKLKDVQCNICSRKIEKNNVNAIGIRKTENKQLCMYVEYQCPNINCKHRACKLLENKRIHSVEDMCYFLIEEIQKRKKTLNAKNYTKPNSSDLITDEEMENIRQFINSHVDYDDFLKYIGAAKEDNNES
jgi:hypothetical protein